MKGEDELNEDILQLLSSTSRSSPNKRKGRKKVSFSNLLETASSTRISSDEQDNVITRLAEKDKDEAIPEISWPFNNTTGAIPNNLNDDESDSDNLPSFSRSQRSNRSKKNELTSATMGDIDDLFNLNANNTNAEKSPRISLDKMPTSSELTNIDQSNNIKRSTSFRPLNQQNNHLKETTSDDYNQSQPATEGKSPTPPLANHNSSSSLLQNPITNVSRASLSTINSNLDLVHESRASTLYTTATTKPKNKILSTSNAKMLSSRPLKNNELSTLPYQPLVDNDNSYISSKSSDDHNMLSSITKQLEQNIHSLEQLENKLDKAQKDTEDLLVKKNDSFHSKLEQRVEEIKNQQESERHKIQNSVDDMMALMKDHYREEMDKLSEKQAELINIQSSVVEESIKMKSQNDSERQSLNDERKVFDEQYQTSLNQLEKKRLELDIFKEELRERETKLLLKYEEHEKVKLKEQNIIDSQKAELKFQQESIQVQMKAMQDKDEILKRQEEKQRQCSIKIDEERMRLQSMAEHLSQLSHQMKIKAKNTDEKLDQIKKMNASIEQYKNIISDERRALQDDHAVVMTSVEEIKVMKMDVVRQRVEYLKEKFK